MIYDESKEISLDAENLYEIPEYFIEIYNGPIRWEVGKHVSGDNIPVPKYISFEQCILCGRRVYKLDTERKMFRQYHRQWVNTAFALFDIVNRTLAAADAPIRFYAVWGGNSLGGIFLTEPEAQAIRTEWLDLKKVRPPQIIGFPWPHLPTAGRPWWNRR